MDADRIDVDKLLSIEDGLTEWEVAFAESLDAQLDSGKPLTGRQREVLDRILTRFGL